MISSIAIRPALAVSACFAVLLILATVDSGKAAFPGENGPIAYVSAGYRQLPTGATEVDPVTAEINTVEPDGSSIRRLTNNSVADFAPTYSPDGKQIAYIRMAPGSDQEPEAPEIWLMNADGTNQHRATAPDSRFEFSPAFSPDGQRLYFVRLYKGADPYPTWHLTSIRLDGTDEREHLLGENVYRFVVLPDGRIAWAGATTSGCPKFDPMDANCNLQIRVANPNASNKRTLTAFAGAPNYFVDEIDSTPDGKQLIVSVWRYQNPNHGARWSFIGSLDPDGPQFLTYGDPGLRILSEDWAVSFGAVSPSGDRVVAEHDYSTPTRSLQDMPLTSTPPPSWHLILGIPDLLRASELELTTRWAWLDWGPKPKSGGDPTDPGGDKPGGDKPGGDKPGGDNPGKGKPGDPSRCRLSYVRSRFFVFRKQQVVRLIAKYRATRPGQVRITFFERGKKNRLGPKRGSMTARFSATTKKKRKFGFIRVRRKRSLPLMKKMRHSKRGFIARLKVKNAPGYCRKLFNLDLELSQLKFVDNQYVWFQKGSFAKGQKPPRFR